MLDGFMRKLIDPPLDTAGTRLARFGITANSITLFGLVLGVFAAGAIALGAPLWGLVLIALSRLADGLDGAVARATGTTDLGGYLDIVADFAFYGLVPLGFALWLPAQNAVPAAFLLVTFYVNGASFLGYAVLAERHGLSTRARGVKSLYFTDGLIEGTETIALFVLVCLWPGLFPGLALLFGVLCLVTAAGRLYLAWRRFGGAVTPDRERSSGRR